MTMDFKLDYCTNCEESFAAANVVCPRCEKKPVHTSHSIRAHHSKLSQLEASFLAYLDLLSDLPVPEKEVYFDARRNWRIDFAYTNLKLAIEIDGGEKMLVGGHTYGEGFVNDRVKQNALVLAGWHVLRFTGSQVKDNPDYCVQCVVRLYKALKDESTV